MAARLTNKQRLFVEAYLSNGLNATDAARRAGYKGNDVTLAAVGGENTRKPLIRARIDERLRQAAMSADEVLFRLTQQAKAPDMTEFIKLDWIYGPDLTGKMVPVDQALDIDLDKIREAGLGHLIKGIRKTRGGLSIEWQDAQSALVQLGRAHGIFKDQMEHSGAVSQTRVNIFIPDNGRNDRT